MLNLFKLLRAEFAMVQRRGTPPVESSSKFTYEQRWAPLLKPLLVLAPTLFRLLFRPQALFGPLLLPLTTTLLSISRSITYPIEATTTTTRQEPWPTPSVTTVSLPLMAPT
jgi:hypothetical protein